MFLKSLLDVNHDGGGSGGIGVDVIKKGDSEQNIVDNFCNFYGIVNDNKLAE